MIFFFFHRGPPAPNADTQGVSVAIDWGVQTFSPLHPHPPRPLYPVRYFKFLRFSPSDSLCTLFNMVIFHCIQSSLALGIFGNIWRHLGLSWCRGEGYWIYWDEVKGTARHPPMLGRALSNNDLAHNADGASVRGPDLCIPGEARPWREGAPLSLVPCCVCSI